MSEYAVGPVRYESTGACAIITMDDGRANALSSEMITELNNALDRAELEEKPVVLKGRRNTFSAGFDLETVRLGGPAALAMFRSGFDLASRLLSFPSPLIIECTGHAVAMSAIVLLCADYRIGIAGPFKITTNEVAIGLAMPRAAVEICAQRLTPAELSRAIILAEVYTPEEARRAGFLDQIVDPQSLDSAVQAATDRFGRLNRTAHRITKLRSREQLIRSISYHTERDFPNPDK
jgi:enoyl-CoA hydratase